MYIRRIKQTNKDGGTRQYIQLVESYRRDDGVPTNRVVAHLGKGDDILFENLKTALAAAKQGQPVQRVADGPQGVVDVRVQKSLQFLAPAVVSHFFRLFGLDALLERLCPPRTAQKVSTARVVEVLVAHRCLEPASKLAFQRWVEFVATDEVFGCSKRLLNNSRVHRCLDELANVEEQLQHQLALQVDSKQGATRVLYLDLTDTWFEAGGGSLVRRGETKQGHRSKRKLHIALMVDESGLPLRWELLKGALNETTVLPSWLEHLEQQERYRQSVLIFDRGLPSIDNFHRLLDNEHGHLFLTAVKSDAIPSYVKLDNDAFDALQDLPDEASVADYENACLPLGLERATGAGCTMRRDLGVVEPPVPNSRNKRRPPAMRGYLYFNPDIRRTKRIKRAERLEVIDEFVATLNATLAQAKKGRKPEPIRSKVIERLRRLKLLEAHEVALVPIEIQGKTKAIRSFRVELRRKPNVLRMMRRYDGVSLLLGHPKLSFTDDEAIAAYRQKNVVEADFRIIKSVLNLRPTFHWTDKKIRAHVTLCVLSLLVERLVELRLRAIEYPGSANAALAECSSVQVHRITTNGKVCTCRTQCPPKLAKLMRSLGASNVLKKAEAKLLAGCSN